jgi:hypothetical protein
VGLRYSVPIAFAIGAAISAVTVWWVAIPAALVIGIALGVAGSIGDRRR